MQREGKESQNTELIQAADKEDDSEGRSEVFGMFHIIKKPTRKS